MIRSLLRKLRKRIRLILNKGNDYECPCCGYKAKGWETIGSDFPVLYQRQVIGGGLRAAGCYKCGATDRERLLLIYLKDVVRLFDGDKAIRILHIAPETALIRKFLQANFAEYVRGDNFEESEAGHVYPTGVLKIDILQISYRDNYFDWIICNHVLEHIIDDVDAMRELRRVLKVGGTGILQVPISKTSAATIEDFSITAPREREKMFGDPNHVRIYNQDYAKRLAQTGFKVQRVNISENFQKYGLNKDEDIFLVEK